MSFEKPSPDRVEVSPATPEQEPVLANLLELYIHDLSEYFDVQIQPNGRFGYPSLPLYWQDQSRFPFLVKVSGQLAGFALVSRGSRISEDPRVWDMAEFFVMRRYRKQGVGAAAATEVWRRFPGAWEIRVLESNAPARAFWKSAIDSFTASRGEEAKIEWQRKAWRVFSFQAP